jgi:ABC-type multidrug transport system ATPase subunit
MPVCKEERNIMQSNREIVVQDLVKQYSGNVLAVKGISFHVKSGEIFGFLGPNGAGKSTTVAMLTTLILPPAARLPSGAMT